MASDELFARALANEVDSLNFFRLLIDEVSAFGSSVKIIC